MTLNRKQEVVATFPIHNTQLIDDPGSLLRIGQVATLYMKGRPSGGSLELF
jgi:hypothetical protein